MERSDLIVQIVDSRNPLLFLCQDVANAVTEVDPNKQSLVIVNKADFLSPRMRFVCLFSSFKCRRSAYAHDDSS